MHPMVEKPVTPLELPMYVGLLPLDMWQTLQAELSMVLWPLMRSVFHAVPPALSEV